MSVWTNVWQHPRTSLSGMLIAVVSVTGVLSGQGIALGHAGSGTVVTLVSALATALLGLLARDPAGKADGSATARVGALMLVVLLMQMGLTGCNATSVAQQIVNWTPTLESAVAVVDATAATLDPVDAPIFTLATAGFDEAANLLRNGAKAYLESPNDGTLAVLQKQVVVLEQQVNGSLLRAAGIRNPASQQQALMAINAVGTAVEAILALVQSISPRVQLTTMAGAASIKLAQVRALMNEQEATQMVAGQMGVPAEEARLMVRKAIGAEMQAGF